jgi:hypothetical protein
MIKVTNITVILPTAPFPGTDYRLIKPGETGRKGDDYFDVKTGQWLPDTNPIDEEEGFDPAIHAPARRKKGPVYKPYTHETLPLPLVVRQAGRPTRLVACVADPDGMWFSGSERPVPYEELLEHFVHDFSGKRCGILVSDD